MYIHVVCRPSNAVCDIFMYGIIPKINSCFCSLPFVPFCGYFMSLICGHEKLYSCVCIMCIRL